MNNIRVDHRFGQPHSSLIASSSAGTNFSEHNILYHQQQKRYERSIPDAAVENGQPQQKKKRRNHRPRGCRGGGSRRARRERREQQQQQLLMARQLLESCSDESAPMSSTLGHHNQKGDEPGCLQLGTDNNNNTRATNNPSGYNSTSDDNGLLITLPTANSSNASATALFAGTSEKAAIVPVPCLQSSSSFSSSGSSEANANTLPNVLNQSLEPASKKSGDVPFDILPLLPAPIQSSIKSSTETNGFTYANMTALPPMNHDSVDTGAYHHDDSNQDYPAVALLHKNDNDPVAVGTSQTGRGGLRPTIPVNDSRGTQLFHASKNNSLRSAPHHHHQKNGDTGLKPNPDRLLKTSTKPFEPLVIVDDNGSSYLSGLDERAKHAENKQCQVLAGGGSLFITSPRSFLLGRANNTFQF